jgi:cytochrome P450
MHGTIDLAGDSIQRAARERAQSIPLEDFDVSNPELFTTDSFWPYFERLRREDPVHYCKDSMFGPYWSVTKYNDIMDIETNHAVFSSAASLGGITIRDAAPDLRRESFIAMDQPRHSAQRKTVAPMFTPTSSRSTFASAPPNASTTCPGARCSTGSTGSRSNSPRRCSPYCSTSPGKTAAS